METDHVHVQPVAAVPGSERFFDKVDSTFPSYDPDLEKDIFTLTTNYTCNEWLDEGDRRKYEILKETDPRRYKVAGLGDWGTPGDIIYENWEVLPQGTYSRTKPVGGGQVV